MLLLLALPDIQKLYAGSWCRQKCTVYISILQHNATDAHESLAAVVFAAMAVFVQT